VAREGLRRRLERIPCLMDRWCRRESLAEREGGRPMRKVALAGLVVEVGRRSRREAFLVVLLEVGDRSTYQDMEEVDLLGREACHRSGDRHREYDRDSESAVRTWAVAQREEGRKDSCLRCSSIAGTVRTLERSELEVPRFAVVAEALDIGHRVDHCGRDGRHTTAMKCCGKQEHAKRSGNMCPRTFTQAIAVEARFESDGLPRRLPRRGKLKGQTRLRPVVVVW
jgi:hypothetical protein